MSNELCSLEEAEEFAAEEVIRVDHRCCIDCYGVANFKVLVKHYMNLTFDEACAELNDKYVAASESAALKADESATFVEDELTDWEPALRNYDLPADYFA